ncbi:MAG: proprotein convertase P-domain-containing protein, partial [candidate division Zixibacteria bacterium]
MMFKKHIVLTSFVLLVGLAGFAQAELMVNPGFEADLEGWKAWGGGSGSGAGGYFWSSAYGTTIIEDGTAHSGDKYLEAILEDQEGWWWSGMWVWQEHPVTEGKAYQISGWLRDGSADGAPSLIADGASISFEWRDAAPIGGSAGERGNELSRATHPFDLTEEWTYVSAIGIAPAGALGVSAGFVSAAGVKYDLDDASFIEILPAQDPDPADGAIGISPVPPLSTYISDDVPMIIPDRWMTTTIVTSSLTVSDPITITDLNVELDITIPNNNADLDVYLIGPDGTQVELFTDVGFKDDDFTNTILDDEASTSVRDGSGRFTGIYKPEGKLSAFDGKNAEGTWKLKMSDDWAGNVGTLNSWRLVIESSIIISWVPVDDIASQDLYFSNNFDEVNDSNDTAYQGNLAADASAVEVALELGQTYYWRIDALDADGMLIAAGDTWSFSTMDVNDTNEAAVNPVPADGAIDIGPNTILKWSHGISAVSSDVYFGTDSSPVFLNTTTGTSYDVGFLTPSTTYYWQIDETDADGNKHTGAVLSFTTVIAEATEPSPADGAILEVTAVVFSWTAGYSAALHDVYLGTDQNALEFQGTRLEPMIPIDGFVRGTTYYWQIVEVEADGTTVHEGPVWSFSIAEPSWSPVAIVNPGFEDPVLAEDDWTWLDVPGWTWVGGEGPGVWNVTRSDFDPVLAPEGQNVLYTENAVGDAGGVAQVLTETFAADTDYTLTVEVG